MLQEIEDSQEPTFGLLPDYRTFDSNLNVIENPICENGEFKWSKHKFEAIIKYVVMEDPSHGRFLKPLLPHIENERGIFFEYLPLKEYGSNRDKCKFLI